MPTDQNDGELLTIKQAAQLLQVSEVSLRRWTDAGKLACSRVGGRRERRFRRDDLLAFMQRQSGAMATALDEPSSEPAAQVLLEGIAINYGHHLCSLYESDLGRIKLAVPFLSEGLGRGDVCFVIADKDVQRDILQHLGAVYPELADVIASGQLTISAGMDSAERMYDYLQENFVMCTRVGNRFLRLLGDMACFLRQGLSVEELIAFEQRYDHGLGHRFPVVTLCQYDVRAFSGMAVLGALKCHEDTFRYPLSRFLHV